MIKITYKDKSHSIEMSGHAGSAPIGEDLVCAAASTLIMALVEYMAENADKLTAFEYRINSGDAFIKAIPSDAFKMVHKGAYDVALTGFTLLTNRYPEYILLESCI